MKVSKKKGIKSFNQTTVVKKTSETTSDSVQGSKLRPIRSPMRLTFSPWRLKFLFSGQFGDLNFV